MTSDMTSRRQQRYTQEYFEELLRQAGYKITPARLQVLNVLGGSPRPLSAHEILEKLSAPRRQIQINHVTIYRSLNSFESDALVRRVPIERDSNYYELADIEDHYLICTNCGGIQSFQSALGEKITRDVRRAGGEAHHHRVQVYGLCQKCK